MPLLYSLPVTGLHWGVLCALTTRSVNIREEGWSRGLEYDGHHRASFLLPFFYAHYLRQSSMERRRSRLGTC